MINLKPRFAKLGGQFFSYTNPTPLISNLRLIHKNSQLLKELGIEDISDEDLIDLTAGNMGVGDYRSIATVYMGHQFGVPVPQLGDGRALLIAEHCDPAGQIWELQLKGSGKTPYSRMGDGRSVLRSTIREYLVSHAMQALNIPTTLATTIVGSDDLVYREEIETASILMRAAPSFIRFGHFEYFAKRKQLSELQQLVDFVAKNYFTDLEPDQIDYIPNFLLKVVKLTAEMIAYWQSVGFVHGVMNSDNMSILGLTIDYGPYAFLDQFAPEHIFNHSDSEGRYTYARQPYIGWWNLYRLAEALISIYDNSERLEQMLNQYAELYNQKYTELMAAKLGLANFRSDEGDDMQLLDELLLLLQEQHVDWTYFWRQLSHGSSGQRQLKKHYPELFTNELWNKLKLRYQDDPLTDNERMIKMLAANPALVPRSHLLQNAIHQAKLGNYQEIERLFNGLSHPFSENELFQDYYQPAPISSQHIVLSCSS